MAKTKYYSSDTPCIISGQMLVDLHHVKSRGSGGKDELWNLMPLAHKYHQECHQIGLRRFADKYPPVYEWLVKNGWDFDPVMMKWRHD
jgi:hypothetical protein